MRGTARFAGFARRKEEAAVAARFETFTTTDDRSSNYALETITSEFTNALLDGPFFQSSDTSAPLPLMNLVFVQSRDGDTEVDDPAALGGGETDKHLIYEGLSRVAADAVMVGARTVGDGNLVFSVWHPRLVALRGDLGKPRHPVQIVASLTGALPLEDGLLFNVPEIAVMIVSAGQPAIALAQRSRSRPWITVVSSGDEPNLRVSAHQLRRDLGICRISAVGGRSLATALIDAGLVTDLYLTTSAIDAGTRDTPMYVGHGRADRDLVVRKRSSTGVAFEHFVLRNQR